MQQTNIVNISGLVSRVYPIKYTPAGLSVLSFVISGESSQVECNLERLVKHNIYCLWVLDKHQKNPISLQSRHILVNGFLSNNKDKQLVLHVKQLTFLDKGI